MFPILQRFFMSPPPTNWQVRGRKTEKKVDSEAAYEEWQSLWKAITRAGGIVHVLQPQKYTSEFLTGLPYAANWGQYFRGKNLFLISRMSAPHRQKESKVIRVFLHNYDPGLEIAQSKSVWEGQADICTLPDYYFLLTFGSRSEHKSVTEIAGYQDEMLSMSAFMLNEPFLHGNTCINLIATPSGPILLVRKEAFPSEFVLKTLEAASRKRFSVIEVNEQDALAYACNALPVNNTLIYLKGLSDALLKILERRGLRLVEIEMPNLCGAGGGGPRCLVNRLDPQQF